MTTQEAIAIVEETIDCIAGIRDGSGEESGESQLIDRLTRLARFLHSKAECLDGEY